MVSETNEGQLDAEGMAELGSDVGTEVDVKIKSEPTEEWILDLTDLGHVEDDAPPPSKRARLGDIEKIIMVEELTDIEINLAQQLLKCQFPEVNGLQSILLQDKQTMLTERSVNDKIQIIHCKLWHHWVVATTMNCKLKFLMLFTLAVTKKQRPLSITFSNGIPKK